MAAVLEARIAVDGGVGSLGEPLGVAPLLVEALVGLGRTADATDLAARYAAATPDGAPPRIRALVARCLALVTPDDGDPAGAYTAAIELATRSGDPFETMGLTLWARRAADELAATDATAADFGVAGLPGDAGGLLVAEGLSNRAVATALFLSPKTVEHHLASSYHKRGFRSRIDLVRAYATDA